MPNQGPLGSPIKAMKMHKKGICPVEKFIFGLLHTGTNRADSRQVRLIALAIRPD